MISDNESINVLNSFFKKSTNVLLYVANGTEYQTTLNFVEQQSKRRWLSICENNIEYKAGYLHNYRVALVKGGSNGNDAPNSVSNILENAIKCFPNIDYVLSVGVCCGVKSKTNVGDVIIAEKTVNYEFVKIENDEIFDRSFSRHSNETSNMLSVGASSLSFNDFSVICGEMITGAKLVKDLDYKYVKDILAEHKEALALDMEGYYIANFAVSHKLTDWFVIKSVSDHGNDKKDNDNQAKATEHSLRVLFGLLKNSNFLKQRRIKVMISGSFIFDNEKTAEAENYTYNLTKKLIYRGYKIINGYGKCIGNAVVAGAYDKVKYKEEGASLQDFVEIYPFPRVTNEAITYSLNIIKTANRQLMAKDCPFTIFIYGLKDNNEKAQGMEDEFALAKQNNSFLIPVGATGYISKEFWKRINQNITEYFPKCLLDKKVFWDKFNVLNKSLKVDRVIDFMDYLCNDAFY